MTAEAVRLCVALAPYKVGPRVLTRLVALANEHGTETVLEWIDQDPGWTIAPNVGWWLPVVKAIWARRR